MVSNSPESTQRGSRESERICRAQGCGETRSVKRQDLLSYRWWWSDSVFASQTCWQKQNTGCLGSYIVSGHSCTGHTYTVEPLEGGPCKRVHRVDLRPCVNSVVKPVVTESSLSSSPSQNQFGQVEVGNTDPDYVVLEEVTLPHLEETRYVGVGVYGSEDALDVEPVNVLDRVEQPAELEQLVEQEQPIINKPVSRRPVPAPRRASRSMRVCLQTHLMSQNRPVIQSHSILKFFSQVLTSLGSVFQRVGERSQKYVLVSLRTMTS